MWFENCSMALESAFQNLQLMKNVEGFFFFFFCHFLFGVPRFFGLICFLLGNTEKLTFCTEVGSIQRSCDSQHTLYLEGWKDAWHTVENIYIKAVDSGNIWKDDKHSQRKRRTLTDLLDLLRSSGLSPNKSTDKVV
jgi:hypothetical protein